MGGIGSGRRWHWNPTKTTQDYCSIDVRRLKRDGLLADGQSYGWQWSRHSKVIASIWVRTETNRVTFTYHYRSGGEKWKKERCPVYLDWSACNLGGKRPWFRCPAKSCNRRVAILYGGGIFACRHCHQLTYQSQRETWDDRAARKANRIREKLGWKHGILGCNGAKPKGMHWKTFDHLTGQHDAFVQDAVAGIMTKIYRV